MNWDLVILLVVVALGSGFVKGCFGLGAGVLFTPILILFIDPFTAVLLMSLFLLFTDIDGVKRYYGRWNKAEVIRILPWGVVGTIGGIWLLPQISAQILQLFIASTALFVVVRQLYLLRKSYSEENEVELAIPIPLTTNQLVHPLIGLVTGMIGYISGAGGIILSMYFIRIKGRIERTATLLAFLTILDIARVGIYVSLGYFDWNMIITALLCIPFLFLGATLGERANNKMTDRTAAYFFTGILGITSAILITIM